jgi:branched-chain amino acid transport system ATP-binding protein
VAQAAIAEATAGAGLSLTLRDVGVRFGGVVALDAVSMAVPAGRVVGVIGPNGAGKTTLFNVICGFVAPERGTLALDGVAWRPRPDRLVGAGIARTLQGTGLFESLTVLENVAAGLRPRAGSASALFGLSRADRDERRLRDEAGTLLAQLGVDRYGSQFPATLPTGVRKRVALARALAARPRLLLLDEPAAGLAAHDIEELALIIAGLPATGCSVLLVEHHLDLVTAVCDEVVVLDFGRVIATGAPATVREDPAVVRAYLGTG